MAVSDDSLLLLHAADGEQWANFIATRLNSPQYKIKSILRNICPPDFGQLNSERRSSASNHQIIDSSKNCSLSNGELPYPTNHRDSGHGSHSTISEFCSILDCLITTRASVIFLSPDSMGSYPFPFDLSHLNPKRSVFLFLGVDIEEVRTFFGEKSDLVFKCRCCLIDVDELSVSDAMVQIIEAFEDVGDCSLNGDDEDDDDVYNVPGCPRQLNRVDRVFPRELTEKDRDVYILLERAAEDDVFVVLNGALPRKISLTCVCERLYLFTLPADASGEIIFEVECQNHCIGKESVKVITKLDRLKAILTDTVNPLAILASALGLASDDLGGIDTTLAVKLQQLAPAMTFDRLFPCEDVLCNAVKAQSLDSIEETMYYPSSMTPLLAYMLTQRKGDTDSFYGYDRADVRYPSLLHFAADFNLRAFCTELLRFPGMLAASLTENSDGEFPSQIAARKGYTLIEADLLHFVENQKCVSELYVSPNPRPHLSGRPTPHLANKQASYINQQETSSGLYIDMGNLQISAGSASEKSSDRSDTDIISPSSESSDNVFLRSFSSKDPDFITEEISQLSLSPKIPDTEQRSSAAMSSKALKMLGVLEEDLGFPTTSSTASPHSRSESFMTSPATPAGNVYHAGVNQVLSDPIKSCFSNHVEEAVLNGHDTKLRTLTKIVSFFGKIKNKRSNSLGENTSVAGRSIKKTLSNRSDKSSKAVLETSTQLKKNKSTESACQERDSGSYSDEDKEKSWTGSIKKISKPKEFRGRGKPLTRRLSQRAQAASKECVRDAPELPSPVVRTQLLTSMNGSC